LQQEVAVVSVQSDPEPWAQRTADILALALEDAGFDVGRHFPLLTGALNRDGEAVVILGPVTPAVAEQLARILNRATAAGVVDAVD
jgi:Ni,Fe-hydrogenase III small subunit